MKPLKDWTLSETKAWCATHKCSGCVLDGYDGCALMNIAPECWRFPRTKVDAANALPVQLDEGAFMPERAHSTDAGLDLRSPLDVLIPCSGGSAIIDTGVHIQLPPNTVGMLKSISIHVPREGHDCRCSISRLFRWTFLSTCPVRGTTLPFKVFQITDTSISIHVPREGHDR